MSGKKINPYDSPVLSRKIALRAFLFFASWAWAAIYSGYCAHEIWAHWSEWNHMSPLDRLNMELSILAPGLEIVMLMAQKAIAEHDRGIMVHADQHIVQEKREHTKRMDGLEEKVDKVISLLQPQGGNQNG